MGWSRDVKADMADMSTSSLTKMFPCTKVWISGDGGTVMYVEIWRGRGLGRERERRMNMCEALERSREQDAKDLGSEVPQT